MDVILLEKNARYGEMGDTVSVKGGYARNYLIPQNKALPATKANVAKFEELRAKLEAESKANQAEAEKFATQLEGLTVKIARQASETGMLYGSVKARDVSGAVADQHKIEVARSQVIIGEPIKAVGEHTVVVTLHPEVSVDLTVTVERQSTAE